MIRQVIGITIQCAKEAAKGNIESLAAPAWRQHHPHALTGDGTNPPPYRVAIDDTFTPTAPLQGHKLQGFGVQMNESTLFFRFPKNANARNHAPVRTGRSPRTSRSVVTISSNTERAYAYYLSMEWMRNGGKSAMKFSRLNRYRTGGTSSHMRLSLPVPRTPDGRIYRFSPNETAHPRHFVLGQVVADIPLTDALRARMKLEPRMKQTVCPYSGTVADDDAFRHPDDVKAAVELVKHEAAQDVQDALAEMLKDVFGGRSSRGPIRITASVKQSTPQPKPRFTRQDLMRELVCDHCGRDYGVFAIGLFCPDCGAPNLRLHFLREVELVDGQVSLAESIGTENEELAYRLLGNAHEDVLTAFEATLKTVYLHGKAKVDTTGPAPKVGNDFQNVDKTLKRFWELGIDPFKDLTEPELAALKLNIQKRHIIGHNLGVVDDKFAMHASDAKVGETVQLVGEDIRQFAAISQKVTDRLDSWLGGSPSPTIDQSPLLLTIKEPTMNPDDPKNLMALDLQISLLARKIGVWVAENCSDGQHDFVDVEKLQSAFSENTEGELKEAIAELEMDGFVETSRMLGGGLPHFHPTLDLYLTFDGPAFDRDPLADVARVGELALSGPESVSAETILEQTGWEVRRFNPAFERVASEVPDGRVSREFGTLFTVPYFHLLPEDRVRVKRLISRLRG